MSGVLLTFDDHSNIGDWVEKISLFARYGVHVTFFIDEADRLTEQQVAGLQKLSAAGHEIGCHGLRHRKAVDAIREMGLSNYLRAEIEPCNTALRTLGFDPVSFCYPSSQRDSRSDAALQKIYQRARTGASVPVGFSLVQSEAFFTPMAEIDSRFCLVAKGIDGMDSVVLKEEILPALDRVKSKNEIIVFYAHDIAGGVESHFVNPEVLELLLQGIRKRELRTYRFCDLQRRDASHGADGSRHSFEI